MYLVRLVLLEIDRNRYKVQASMAIEVESVGRPGSSSMRHGCGSPARRRQSPRRRE